MEDGIEREQLTIIDKIEKNKHIYSYIPDKSDW